MFHNVSKYSLLLYRYQISFQRFRRVPAAENAKAIIHFPIKI